MYDFGYIVANDHPQNFNHKENRDGYQTHGEYSVALADGRIMRVIYQVNGDSGFIADVSYEGEARPYDYTAPKPAPKYVPAPAPVPPPAPVVYKPAPVVYKPAPIPVVYKPAPVPAPVYPAPAPAPAPAPKQNIGTARWNPFG